MILRNKLPNPIFALILALSLLAFNGCQHNPASPPTPLAAGAVDQIDANAYRALADTQAFMNSITDQQNAGKIVLTPTEKTIFNQVIADYNIALPLANAYHAAAATTSPTALQSAINKMQTDTSAAQAQIATGK